MAETDDFEDYNGESEGRVVAYYANDLGGVWVRELRDYYDDDGNEIPEADRKSYWAIETETNLIILDDAHSGQDAIDAVDPYIMENMDRIE